MTTTVVHLRLPVQYIAEVHRLRHFGPAQLGAAISDAAVLREAVRRGLAEMAQQSPKEKFLSA